MRDVILVRDDNTISSLQLECDREKTKQLEITEKEKTRQMELQLEIRKLDLEEKRLMMGIGTTSLVRSNPTPTVEPEEEGDDNTIIQEQAVISPPPAPTRRRDLDASSDFVTTFFSRETYDAFVTSKIEIDYRSREFTQDLIEAFEAWAIEGGIHVAFDIRGGNEHSYFFNCRFKDEFIDMMERATQKKQIRIKIQGTRLRGFRGLRLIR
jgi:hypothetical protein